MLRCLLATLTFTLACTSANAATVSFNDPGQHRQWYLDRLNFSGAWSQIMNLPQRGHVKVAVVDSGFDTDHHDLKKNLAMWQGINIVNHNKNLEPVHPHGTGTIGLLAATSGNGRGITQTAWSARTIPIRVSNRSDGAATSFHLAEGIRYAADSGARVINLSYAGVHLGYLQKAAKYAQSRGAVVFMAAGNGGKHQKWWRNHKHLVAVGSIDQSGQVSSFSNRGAFVDLVAPGRDILSLHTNDRVYNWSGTSFSSPIAASVAALMLVANPELAPWQVRRLLEETATDIGPAGVDNASGHGLVNAEAAVAAAIRTRGWYQGKPTSKPITFVPNVLDSHAGLRVVSQLQAVTEPAADLVGTTAVPEPGSLLIMMVGGALLQSRPGRRRAA